MKISNLIEYLTQAKAQYGDLECASILHTFVSPEIWGYNYEMSLIEPNIEVVDNPCGDGKIVLVEHEI